MSRTFGFFFLSTLISLSIIMTAAVGWAQDRDSRVVLDERTNEWLDGTFGGPILAEQLGEGCVGYVSDIPNYVLEVQLDGWVRLSVNTQDDQDTTLLLVGEGESYCNDDANDYSRNPEIATFLTTGEYYVYVGGLNPDSRGDFRIHFRAGPSTAYTEYRSRRSLQLNGISGGDVAADSRLEGCPGTIGQSPNHVIRLFRPQYLDIGVHSTSDLTLLVLTGEGARCNDDGLGSLDPTIVGWFPEGFVRIFVGSHNPRITAPYTLMISPHTTE